METYPLSNAQARIWLHSQLEGGAVAYNMPVALDLEGELDARALESALRRVITRHESLRTSFIQVDGVPRQKIVPAAEIEFQLVEEDLRGRKSPAEDADQRVSVDLATPFDLTCAPLLRARLFRIAERRWVFLLVVHHIAGDGWSLQVLLKEIASCYAGENLPSLSLQYKDYSAWMSRRVEENAFTADRAFWTGKLAPPHPRLSLPSDHPRPEQIGIHR